MSLSDIVRRDRTKTRTGPYARNGPANPKKNRVFIGNLPWAVQWKDLKEIGQKYGTVTRSDIRQEFGRSKGWGCLVFASSEEAQNCIDNLNGETMDGRELIVRLDKLGGIFNDDKGRVNADNPNPKKNRVFIGNVPWAYKWQDLKDLCSKYGTITRSDIALKDGRSNGYGCVVFSTAEDAEKCVEGLVGEVVDGRELIVKLDEKGGIFNAPHKNITRGNSGFGSGYNTQRGGGMQIQTFGNHRLSDPMSSGGAYRGRGPVKIFIGNLPWTVKWQELKDMCRSFGGDITRCEIEIDGGGRSKGYGIVTCADVGTAENLIQNLNGKFLDDRELTVRFEKY